MEKSKIDYQVGQITDSLLKLESDVNNGLLSPRDTANKIRLITDYIKIVLTDK
tara:strand:+ start:23 stop:181 length:159 start_codon:yes stop_codon:yes gene_type:complete